MATLLKERRFIKSDIANNNNKFWYIELYDDGTVITRNGRVGDKGQIHTKSLGSESEGDRFFESKIREKTGDRKGYTELKVVIGSGAQVESQTIAKSSLSDIAVKQITTNDTIVQKLIKYLSKKNIHNIISATTITYDESKGTFSTPCGIVTQDGIDEARDILNTLAPSIEKGDFSSSDFTKLIQQYIQIIPRKTARKLVLEDVIPNSKLIEEYQILDALSASLQEVLTKPVAPDNVAKPDEPKIFSLSLDFVTDKKIIDHIIKFYNKTKNSIHTSSNLHVDKVYAVKINHMYDAFENKGSKIGNIMELWHGTRVENVLSILKSGLIIPPANASQCSGRMFGNGLYFSDQSTKSLNYAQGYWGHGSTDNNCFMFLADVAMGKYFVPTYCETNIPSGYDSFFAKANVSGVRNNEMIVPHLYQANLKYLVEFTE